MMIYPRVLALAEVAWSAPSKKNYEDFHVRALKAVEELKNPVIILLNLRTKSVIVPELISRWNIWQ